MHHRSLRVNTSDLADGDLTLILTGINLHTASTPHIERYAGHIGFTVHPPHRGHRYAARSVRLLLPVARQPGMLTNPENVAIRHAPIDDEPESEEEARAVSAGDSYFALYLQ